MHKIFLSLVLLLIFNASPSFIFSLSVSDLSLEEKVGQLLIVHFNGQEANEEARELIQDLHVGGIIYYNWANGLKSPSQVQNLSSGLQQLAQKCNHPIPLLIAADQEGGRVVRLKNGFTQFPGNYALGRSGEWQWAEEMASIMAEELKAVGVSLNLSPVVDVFTEPANPIIGIRSFSSDPIDVAKWGEQSLKGYKKCGIIAAIKHFPGHGDVLVDSHEGLPIIRKGKKELDLVELYPFRHLVSQAELILTAHLMVPALDKENCVTFSKKIITDLLRNEMGFKGVIITDSLAMQGILSQSSSLEDAVLKSLEAGHDLILLGGKQLLASQSGLEFNAEDVKRVQRFLLNAVKDKKLSEEQIDQSVSRILSLKKKYGLFNFTRLDPLSLNDKLKTEAHCALGERIAKRALHLIKGDKKLPIDFKDSSYLIVASESLQEELNQTTWQSLEPQSQFIYFKGSNPDAATIQEIVSAIQKTNKKCLYFSSNTWQFPGQKELFQQIQKNASFTVAIAVRDPIDANFLSEADVVLCTFSPVAVSLQAAYDFLNGNEEKKFSSNIPMRLLQSSKKTDF